MHGCRDRSGLRRQIATTVGAAQSNVHVALRQRVQLTGSSSARTLQVFFISRVAFILKSFLDILGKAGTEMVSGSIIHKSVLMFCMSDNGATGRSAYIAPCLSVFSATRKEVRLEGALRILLQLLLFLFTPQFTHALVTPPQHSLFALLMRPRIAEAVESLVFPLAGRKIALPLLEGLLLLALLLLLLLSQTLASGNGILVESLGTLRCPVSLHLLPLHARV
mmetsp:Transcript_145643/g.271210  ORF Transcript_145643/g.271210 Transcript_145643/m.271210 type:complete len:222 (-) Transcript_145643:571-1236(-)